jgi:flagellar basal-body rod protein FlgB
MGLMDTTDLLIQRALDGASLRQQVLTNNLANADTPGFKASDVNFQSSLNAALASSNPQASLQNLTFSPTPISGGGSQTDGNNVDLNQQMAELTQNAVEYETLTEVEKARMSAIQHAIGGSA